ncbi:MAG: tRNA 2-thiouridine(34) synthase MnmA [Parcubacteria group bacterium]|nr:tRNA 2-thiouridine(34) synthase MnmA [Parcubacteria group bacterium]
MKVFIGLSGGVDSAVAAHLLRAQGHSVTGVFIKIWQPEFLECAWEEDRLSAKRVAAALGIPFREIDCSDTYKEEVVRDMITSYESGITPNPDVLCNQHIKFGAFLEWALAEGADAIATGHYARRVEKGGTYELHRGIDAGKDQSYFLHRLTQRELARAFFPIGEYPKKEIRRIAGEIGLPNAARPDSQGLCFVGEVSIGDFLARFIPMRDGDVLNRAGKVIGSHAGAARYTIGQRHGFTVHGEKTSAQTPHYVIAIDGKENTITVSESIEDAFRSSAQLHDVSWIGEAPTFHKPYAIEARYHQQPQQGRIERGDGESTRIVLSEAQILTAGQSAVLYEGSRCLGGGIIG